MHTTNKEVFELIIADKLTSHETDIFIEKETNGFKLAKLEKLIIDYETYILDKKPESIINFQALLQFGFVEASNKDVLRRDTEFNAPTGKKESKLDIVKRTIAYYKSHITELPDTTRIDTELPDYLSYRAEYPRDIMEFSPIFYVVSRMEENKGNIHKRKGAIHFKELKNKELLGEEIFENKGWFKRVLLRLRTTMRSINPFKRDSKSDPVKVISNLSGTPLYKFYKKLHECYNLHRSRRIKEISKATSDLLTPNQSGKPQRENSPKEFEQPSNDQKNKPYTSDSPEREFSPKKCARDFINDSGSTKYPEHVIEFVMARAEKCDYDNIANLIREIREDPECPDEIKEKNKDTKAERNWINYYYEKNKIPKGTMKKKLSSTSKN